MAFGGRRHQQTRRRRRGRRRMNLILLEPGEVDPSGAATLTDRRAAHAMHVLKVVPGVEVRIGLLDGPIGVGVVRAVASGSILLHCRFDADAPPRPMVNLLLALPRPKVMRRLWAQIAAIGVDRIVLTNAGRVERQYFDTHVLTPDSYRPLLVEGLEQAKDTRLPRVSIHRRFRVLVEDDLDTLFGSGVRLLADPVGGETPGAMIMRGLTPPVLLAVGPEGGWNTFERGLLAAHGFATIGMGPRILRTDTACIALLALVHAALVVGPER
jgi:RsmE family RNA methyltransferase